MNIKMNLIQTTSLQRLKFLGFMLLVIILGNKLSYLHAKPPINFSRLADAIFHAEGGWKTNYPYGIKIKNKRFTERKARQLCWTTISNRYSSWDGHGEFIKYLATRYCPPSVDPTGHVNWIKNVNYFYTNPKPIR